MARLRTLKPSFFTNDMLAEVDPLGRLLFQGLWCIADREGRLEDRPKRIKAEVLPYDACDVDALLNDLARLGFIERYIAGEQRYIQVTNFGKHQTPHIKEAASTIPAPDKHGASTVRHTPQASASTPSYLDPDPDPELGSSSGEGDAPALPREEPAAPAAAPPKRVRELTPAPKTTTTERETRIPDDFAITPEMRAWAAERVPGLDIDYQFEEFCTYWRSVKTKRLNWVQTWQNGMLKKYERMPPRAVRAAHTSPPMSGPMADQRVASWKSKVRA